MIVHQPGKLEHVDLLFAIKDGLERSVGLDRLFLLQVVFLDVLPKLFRELSPGKGV